MDRRRYSTMLVLAAAALVAEACSSSNGNKGTGGADGGSSSGGKTGTGGKTDAGTGGVTGTGGKTDAGTGGMGTGGKVDAGDSGTGGMGTGGKVDAGDSGTDTVTDTAMDMSVNIDTGLDADPAAPEKLQCATQTISSTPFTAAQFCTLYLEICNNVVGARAFASQAECETAYSGYNTDPDAGAGTEGPNGQKGCRSQHLCLANMSAPNLITHCPHATGLNNNDAGPGGPCP
jgi:hypothetical protein